ncbi:GerAB/ArcD/ProY family transporter [Paenibacillus sp. 22594]|uniref:GerAB/ArcD/ProY family transporter n=1 Tax=Paenibacillus sp. 22594 TaxID=3453947 RepID=UPI003F86276C
MKAKAKDRITTPQATIIMVNYILAAGILTLPRVTVEAGKTPDVWISVILGGLLSMLAAAVIAKLSQRFPGQTFFQYCRLIIGKPLGILLGTLAVGYFLCVASFEMRTVQEVTGFFLLEGTPAWAISAIFIWIGLYLCMGGINAISRICRLIVPITWTVFFGASLLSLELFDLNNLRPVLGEGLGPVWKAIKPTALTFTAGEVMLILVAFMDKPNKAMKVVVVGTLIPMLFYVVAVVLTIGAFSIEGVVTRTWPFLDLVRSFEVKYLILERFESLLMAIWIMQIFCTFCITFYAAALGLSQMINKKFQNCLFALLPIVYIVSQVPPGINGLFALGTGLGNFSMTVFGLIPLPLLIIAHFRRAGS